MKRKKYYTKGKFELQIPYKANPIEVLRSIRPEKNEKEKVWLKFVDNGYKRIIKENPAEDLNLILKLIHSKQTVNKIIKYFYQIDGYDPNNDDLPLDENTPKDILNIIRKKQNYINQFLNFEKQITGNKRGFVMFNKINTFTYLSLFDVVVGLSGEYIYIYAKDLNSIYLILNEMEPDTWELREKYILNWKKKTSLNFLNKKILKKFLY